MPPQKSEFLGTKGSFYFIGWHMWLVPPLLLSEPLSSPGERLIDSSLACLVPFWGFFGRAD